jgi:alpha-tubulin suppressor-like RCC1 family protein
MDQLGLGDFNDRNIPKIILFFTKVNEISTGLYHSLFLNDNGTVSSFGNNQVFKILNFRMGNLVKVIIYL